MSKRWRRLALAAALACAGNLFYAGFIRTAAAQDGCSGGCSGPGQCGEYCACFPNPFCVEGGCCAN